MLNAVMYAKCETPKQAVPTVKEESSLNISSTSPSREKNRPNYTKLGIRCSLGEFFW